jgi:hypothetical protein
MGHWKWGRVYSWIKTKCFFLLGGCGDRTGGRGLSLHPVSHSCVAISEHLRLLVSMCDENISNDIDNSEIWNVHIREKHSNRQYNPHKGKGEISRFSFHRWFPCPLMTHLAIWAHFSEADLRPNKERFECGSNFSNISETLWGKPWISENLFEKHRPSSTWTGFNHAKWRSFEASVATLQWISLRLTSRVDLSNLKLDLKESSTQHMISIPACYSCCFWKSLDWPASFLHQFSGHRSIWHLRSHLTVWSGSQMENEIPPTKPWHGEAPYISDSHLDVWELVSPFCIAPFCHLSLHFGQLTPEIAHIVTIHQTCVSGRTTLTLNQLKALEIPDCPRIWCPPVPPHPETAGSPRKSQRRSRCSPSCRANPSPFDGDIAGIRR